jgi:S-adenosylmethionine hydrolase
MAIITLTTDFGLKDNYVGVMKGVILGIDPGAVIVDLAHDAPAHDPAAAAFVLFTAKDYFPEGTIHVAVVDPGVGSDRAILVVRSEGRVYIAPDNGALSYIVEECPGCEIREATNRDLMLPEISRTFHGRDVMAPIAAHLGKGTPFSEVGPEIGDIIRLPSWHAEGGPDEIVGRVTYVDRFGNLITNIRAADAEAMAKTGLSITAAHVFLLGLKNSYSEVKPGQWAAIIGSSGFLEIARYMEKADHPPTLTLGTQVVLKRMA